MKLEYLSSPDRKLLKEEQPPIVILPLVRISENMLAGGSLKYTLLRLCWIEAAFISSDGVGDKVGSIVGLMLGFLVGLGVGLFVFTVLFFIGAEVGRDVGLLEG
jgi:hypothetical protein